GNEDMREIYEEARSALTDRIFESSTPEELAEYGLVDTPAVRLMVRGWSALTEEVVLSWIDDPRGLDREQLLSALALSLSAIVGCI
ncbi:MAG TPA: TetR/AcrR family transcriptional regulator, partial [Nocardioides sp.]